MNPLLLLPLLAACRHHPVPPPLEPVVERPVWIPTPEHAEIPLEEAPELALVPLELGGDRRAPQAIEDAARLGDGLLLAMRGLGAVVYDPARPAELRAIGVPEVQRVAVDGAGAFAVVGEYEALHGIEVATGTERWVVKTDENPGGIAFLPDGRSFVAAVRDRVERRDAATGALLWTWKMAAPATDNEADTVGALVVSPDGRTVFTHSHDRVHALDAKDGSLQKDLIRLADRVGSLAVSPDGELLVAGGWDRSFRLVRVGSGEEILKVLTPGWVTDAAWAPDGSAFAIVDLEGGLDLRSASGARLGAADTDTDGLIWLASGTLIAWGDDEAFTVQVP